MQSSDIPVRFPKAFGASAGGSYIRAIPTDSQIGVHDGWASLTDGFPPLNFNDIGAGGVPPFGQDVNGILKWVTQWCQWQAAGIYVPYDGTFSTAISGYPKYAILSSTTLGVLWQSTAENNTTDPDGGSPANWARLIPLKADDSDVIAGTDDDMFITPKALRDSWTSGVNADGEWEQTPAGILRQWGSATSGTNGSITYNFPTAFNSSFPINIVASATIGRPTAADGNSIWTVAVFGGTQFQLGSDDTPALCNWQAIGHAP